MLWSPQQDAALAKVAAWTKDRNGPQTFYLAGYAGTGKTTLAKHLAASIDGTTVFGAFTGKAALVLQQKGCPASTIHSLIYRPKKVRGMADPEWILNRDGALKDAELVVIDECSMVGEDLGKDLLSFGKKVLVLGDPAQLPPIRGEGFFTAGDPDFLLTEVHRQARDNPIIAMSMRVRLGKDLPIGSYGSSRVMSRKDLNADMVLAADQVLVGLNKSRRLYNGRIRQLKGFKTASFATRDRVVCLKNRQSKGLLNGSLWQVVKIGEQTDDTTQMFVKSLDELVGIGTIEVKTHHAFYRGEEAGLDWRHRKAFEEFDFGYALTCHKSQGSQWDKVLVFDESGAFRQDADRWLYTAITRAAENVEVVV